ncbi:MAG: hypothetical protein ACJAU0_001303 [Flavobacteriales bacterium]|jgi:hypothetical protein
MLVQKETAASVMKRQLSRNHVKNSLFAFPKLGRHAGLQSFQDQWFSTNN